ncbi:MAG: thiosulfate oxidation carrier complex protein SoxZ [Magnetococcales bacterium]|nr:thiosulfate oxidation carrier complex protein SoxZ [Magnetococcales bacterium]
MAIGKPKVRGPRKAVAKGEVVQFKSLIKHPMESGLRKNQETGQAIPAHYIESVTVVYGGKTVLSATWTGSISKNPFFSFYVKAAKTGDVTVTWKDNQGKEFTANSSLKVA